MAEIGNRLVRLADCRPHPQNYNRHDAGQIADLRRSLRAFGQVRSIVVQAAAEGPGYLIVAGHGLVAAAQAEGWTELRADVIPADWPAARVLAYLAADNELARRGDPDEGQLAALVAQVAAEADANLASLAAGSEARMAEMLAGLKQETLEDPGASIDKAEELREKWGVKLGQMWQLGEHRLICGDCADAAVLARVMGGEKAGMVFTSPPYNRGTTTGGGFNDGGLSQQLTNAYDTYGDNLTVEEYRKWQEALLLSWWNVLRDGGAIYYNHRPRVQAGIFETALDWNPGLPVRQIVIWHSGAGINFAPTHYRPCCEWIVIYAKPAFRLSSKGESGIGDVWQFGAATVDGHPAPFPVELPLTALETTTLDIILDPFLGSGTTLIACEKAKRKCRAVEISPAYVAVALQRWADMTGKTPALIET